MTTDAPFRFSFSHTASQFDFHALRFLYMQPAARSIFCPEPVLVVGVVPTLTLVHDGHRFQVSRTVPGDIVNGDILTAIVTLYNCQTGMTVNDNSLMQSLKSCLPVLPSTA